MSFMRLNAIFSVAAFVVPKASEWSPETFDAVKLSIAENHGVIVKEGEVDGDRLTLAFIGDNGKHIASTGQVVVFDQNDSTIEVFHDLAALGKYYREADSEG